MPKSPTPAELLSLSEANGIHRLYFPIDWSCSSFCCRFNVAACPGKCWWPNSCKNSAMPWCRNTWMAKCIRKASIWFTATPRCTSDFKDADVIYTSLHSFLNTSKLRKLHSKTIPNSQNGPTWAKTFKTSQRTTDRSSALPLPPVKSTPSTMPSAANWMRCEMLCFKRCNTTLTNSFDLTTASSQQLGLIQNHIESWNWSDWREVGEENSMLRCFFDHFFTLFGSSLLLFALVPWSLDPLVPWSAPGWAGQERQALFIDGSNETEVCFSGQPMAICCAFGAGAESQIEMVIPLKKK